MYMMKSLFVVGAFLLADSSSHQTPASSSTIWDRIEGRAWNLCVGYEQIASKELRNFAEAKRAFMERSDRIQHLKWQERVKECPHNSSVLLLAALHEMSQEQSLPAYSARPDKFNEFAKQQKEQRERAKTWLLTAFSSTETLTRHSPWMAYYLLAIIELASHRTEAANIALLHAQMNHELMRGEAELFASVSAFLRGESEQAIHLAEQAQSKLVESERYVPAVMKALAYDRAGATDATWEEFKHLRAERSDQVRKSKQWLGQLLPFHEQLYLAALSEAADGNKEGAIRYWQHYLEQAEPEAPERKLAERHIQELL